MMSFVPVFVPLCAVLALLFALYLAGSVRKEEEGTDRMKEISGAIREGANALYHGRIFRHENRDGG